MLKRVRGPLILIVLVAVSTGIPAQTPTSTQPPVDGRPAAPAPVTLSVFSGYVSELSSSALTVTRKSTIGHEVVKRVFMLDGHTKVEGKLRFNVRVSVRYEPMPEGNRADRIIVRAEQLTPKPIP